MAVEIKITGETAEKAHQELQSLANLIFNQPVLKSEGYVQLAQNVMAPETAAAVAQEEPVVEVKPARATRARKAPATEAPKEEVAEAKEETPKVEAEAEVEAKVEEAPKPDVKEEVADKEAPLYSGDFVDCKTEEDVMNKIRVTIGEVNKAAPGNPKKTKDIFAKYGASTLLKLSTEQAMAFYEELKAI